MNSNTILWLFMVVIICAALGYLAAFLVKKKNAERLKELEKRKLALFDLPVIAEIEEVKQMHLVGQSQSAFRDWQKKWKEIESTDFAELESEIFAAETLNETFKFMGVKTGMAEAEETMEKMEQKVAKVRRGLKELHDQEANNSVAVQEVMDRYEEVKEQLETEADSYGPAFDTIQKDVESIDNQFKQFVALNTSGDPMEAGTVLEKAEASAKALSEKIVDVPAYFKELDQEFPTQMAEIEEGYKTLVEQNYHFPVNNIEEQIMGLNVLVSKNLENLAEINLEAVKEENEVIADEIDKLYDIMEREIESKKFVDKTIPTATEYMEHIAKNNHQLVIELDHISQSYALNNNELGRARGFQTQLEVIEKDFKATAEKIKGEQVIYSFIEDEMKEHLSALEEIENNQIAINDDMNAMREGEKLAQDKIDEFEFELRGIKRHVDQQRLPGVPGDYLDFFYVATNRIEELSRELNKMRIDMDRINQLVEFCEQDLVVLNEKTDELIDSAALTEQMLQYANRYRMTDDEMAQAVANSYHLFTQEHRYNDALDEIGVALEKIEPGAFKRIEAAYFNSKGTINQF